MSYQDASLYIHIPFCVKKCFYCDFFSKTCGESGIPDSYVRALKNEILSLKNVFDITSWKTIYIGGGTPSLLTVEQLEKITEQLKSAAPFSHGYEFTIEMNPQDMTEELLFKSQELGINRVSTGIQSFDDRILKAIGRRTTKKDNLKALKLLDEHWKGEISLDLITGLPFQTEESLKEDLKILTDTRTNHISLYSLCIEEGTRLEELISSGELPYNFDSSDELWLKARDFLKTKGFTQYEVSNFCKDGKFSLHNTNYWKLNTYFACGSGATGTVFTCDESIRWTDTENIEKYTDFWKDPINFTDTADFFKKIPGEKELIDSETEEFEYLMMNLRTSRGINENDFSERFRKNLEERLDKNGKIFSDWQKKGLSQIKTGNSARYFSLTEKGLLFLNRFLESL